MEGGTRPSPCRTIRKRASIIRGVADRPGRAAVTSLAGAQSRRPRAGRAIGYEVVIRGVGNAVAVDGETGGEKRAVGNVPELEGVVAGCGDDEASVGGEGDRIHIIIMSVDGFQLRAIGIRDFYLPIISAGAG